MKMNPVTDALIKLVLTVLEQSIVCCEKEQDLAKIDGDNPFKKRAKILKKARKYYAGILGE